MTSAPKLVVICSFTKPVTLNSGGCVPQFHVLVTHQRPRRQILFVQLQCSKWKRISKKKDKMQKEGYGMLTSGSTARPARAFPSANNSCQPHNKLPTRTYQPVTKTSEKDKLDPSDETDLDDDVR